MELIMNKLPLSITAIGLAAAALAAHAIPRPVNLLGDSVPVVDATRTVVIDPSTKYVNVTEGDVVKFVDKGHEFAFKFDSPVASAVDLRRVAPPGALDHHVIAYVAPNTDTMGDRD
jgi:hypothetical protein